MRETFRASTIVRLQMKRQPRLLDVGQRDTAFDRPSWAPAPRLPTPSLPRPPGSLPSIRPPCSGARTFAQRPTNRRHSAGVAQRTLARRRHLQHVLRRHQLASVQPRLERARSPRAVVDRDRRPVAPIDANLDQRPALRPPAPQLDEVESDRVKLRYDNTFQRVLHISSRKSSRIKKCGEPPPHFTRGPRRPQSYSKSSLDGVKRVRESASS